MLRNLFLVLWILPLLVSPGLVNGGFEFNSKTTYTCLSNSSGGFNWDGNEWRLVRFKSPDKFLLEIFVYKDGDRVSRHYAVTGDGLDLNCDDGGVNFGSCRNVVGQFLVFSSSSLRGGISSLLGSTSTDLRRDSLVITPFVCVSN
jgi:hypothetical protein